MKTRNKLYDKSRLRLLCLLTALLGLFGAGQAWAQTKPSSGAGTQDNPYQISTADELRWFAGLVNGTLTDGTAQNKAAWATLTDDIDLTGADWTPIGSDSTPYTGTFDGAGHTISNLTVDNSSANFQGFVGYLESGGAIQNLTLGEGCSVSGKSYVGGICGDNEGGTLTNCTNTGTVTGKSFVGGICGYIHIYCNVTYCTNSGKISSSDKYTGGICGYSYSLSTVTNCINSGEVSSNTSNNAGGICGYNNAGTVTNCYNTGSVTGSNYLGGICGYASGGTITYCYNTGSVNSTSNSGAIVGQSFVSSTITCCYYLTGTANGGIDGSDATGQAEVKTAEEFKSGAVAYLLQGSQTALTWGQTLGTDDYPVLTTDEAKRVYAAKMYNGSADDVTEVYAATSGFSRPEGSNALCVIEDALSASTGANIVVKSGEAYTCANLVLTDGADFYTPVAFTAAQATYSRPLADGTQWGTVALPFDATTVTGAELFRVARQEGDALLYVDETNGMAGGEPLVFRANAEVTEVGFMGTDVAVRATDAEAGSTLLKGTSQTVSQLDAGAYFIYGDKFYRVASGSQVGVKPFRAYIPATAGDLTRSRSAGAASQLRIVFNASETTRTAHEGK